MKVLVCHNSYQHPGGEDEVFRAECELLSANGHDVVQYRRSNDELHAMSNAKKLRDTFWSKRSDMEVTALIEAERPDILHCHNTFPLISPSVYQTARRHSIGVVQTLHNYRLICPSADMLKDGRVCTNCLGKSFAWPAIAYRCYRNSHAASATVATMLTAHRLLGTWHKAVDRYIALTEFSREKLIEGGFPDEKILVKPNFVPKDPGLGKKAGNYAVFVGRLSEEKGLRSLLEAWQNLDHDMELHVLGDGPLRTELNAIAERDSRIRPLGHCEREKVMQVIGNAQFLLVPSICFETFGLSAIEAFSMGVPVLASRIGALQEVVKDGYNGLHFEPGIQADIQSKIDQIVTQTTVKQSLSEGARQSYETLYSAQTNYKKLMTIYQDVIAMYR